MSKDSMATDSSGLVIRDHVTIRDMVVFKSGGVADYLAVCRSPDEIVRAVTTAMNRNVPYRVIGKGSNILFSDSGFPGLIVQNQTSGIVFIHDRSQVMVESGVPVEILINRSASLGYSGLEFLYGYPGTIGGAVLNNRGRGKQNIGQYVRSATMLTRSRASKPVVRRVTRDWFQFSPQGSCLKLESQRHPVDSIPIMLTLTFQLSRMSHSTCIQKVRETARANKSSLDRNRPTIQAFTNLSTSHTAESNISSLPVIQVTRQQIRHWHLGTASVVMEDPNYIKNHNHATSRDAARLIRRMKEEGGGDNVEPNCSLDFLGLWEFDELP